MPGRENRDSPRERLPDYGPGAEPPWYKDLQTRWINATCRILMHVRQYHHGGGILILPHPSLDGLDVKYRLTYDRLLPALVGLARAEAAWAPWPVTDPPGAASCWDQPADVLPFPTMGASPQGRAEIDHRKSEVLGTIRFIAALTCVDGMVLLDRRMAVRGFGVEVRSDTRLDEIFLAGDAQATSARLRRGEPTQFGTRHRALMRYCYQHPGALGLAVSQDGDIQVITRLGEHLVMWEKVDVQLALRAEEPAEESAEACAPHQAGFRRRVAHGK